MYHPLFPPPLPPPPPPLPIQPFFFPHAAYRSSLPCLPLVRLAILLVASAWISPSPPSSTARANDGAMAPATTAETAAIRMEKCRVDWLLRQLTHRRTASWLGRAPSTDSWDVGGRCGSAGARRPVRLTAARDEDRCVFQGKDGDDLMPSGIRSCGAKGRDVGRLLVMKKKAKNVDPAAGRATHTPPPPITCFFAPLTRRTCPSVASRTSWRMPRGCPLQMSGRGKGHGRGKSAVVLDRALPFVSFRGTDLYRARGLATDYS